eukprot:CFRG4137T1
MKITALLCGLVSIATGVYGWENLENQGIHDEIRKHITTPKKSPADGLLDSVIEWTAYPQLRSKTLSSIDFPIMVLIHRTWCESSNRLKNQLANSSEIQELSKQFTMVKVDEYSDPLIPQWQEDGRYTPRIVFIPPHGKGYPMPLNINNAEMGNKQYPYYYWKADQVVASMHKVLEIHELDYADNNYRDEEMLGSSPYDVKDVHEFYLLDPADESEIDETIPHLHRRSKRDTMHIRRIHEL